MPQKPGSAIKRYKRRATAERRVGVGAKCATCPEARPEVLIAGSKPKICEKCDRKRRGRATEDLHHPAGKANSSVTIEIPVNMHRVLSFDQCDWPQETLENPNGDPDLAIAGSLRGFVNTSRALIDEQRSLIEKQHYLLDQLLQPLPELLEARAKSKQKRKGKT
jgi:hypothetical protein